MNPLLSFPFPLFLRMKSSCADEACYSCERENIWLDESAYAVDTSILPRGGSRRRKSMEPRALLNMNGNLSNSTATDARRRIVSAEMTKKMRDELIHTPLRNQVTAHRSPVQSHPGDEEEREDAEDSPLTTPTHDVAAATPTGFVSYDPSTSETPAPASAHGVTGSPTTPYYLSQGAKLVQMTCPPKQTNRGLFEDPTAEGGNEGASKQGAVPGKMDEKMRKRLMEARRRTLGFKPVAGSPLGR
jgi:hypothetical protein